MFLPSKFHEIPFMNVALAFALKAEKNFKGCEKIFIWHGILKLGCHGTFPTPQIVALLIRIV